MKVTSYSSGAKVSNWSSQPDPNWRHKLKCHESFMRVRESRERSEILVICKTLRTEIMVSGGVHRNGYNCQPHLFFFLLHGMAGTKAGQKKIMREKRESSNYIE